MKLVLPSIVLAFACSPSASSQDAAAAYQARYHLAGFILRSATVCPDKKKQAIDLAFSLLKSKELRSFSQAFPQTIQKWMMEGAANLNTGVMQDGLGKACEFAYSTRASAAQLAKEP